ncbi:GNAT family N-acetyltransferase [Ensifer adhaerens]|uniref:GNAT family N-acetyltransferase n=1 Tax=Ensifer adhaerens TaxID=106592 RepID=UPI001319DFB9|nr:GNAT family N-acetyltransferase [Ensifer adhaerens]
MDRLELRLRRATTADVEELGYVGPAAYAAEYAYLWDNGAALARQLATFSSDAFSRLMARPEASVWVAEIDATIVGFLTMIAGSADPIQSRPGGAEIPRIYLLPGAKGHGIGHKLLDCAIAQARQEGARYVWLDVMASARQARSAYLKWGFVELGATRFPKPVKAELADMIVLARQLD